MTSPQPQPSMNVQVRFRFRRAWRHEWEIANPVLRDGEPGFDKTLKLMKIGDGSTPWNDLEYLASAEGEPDIITGDVAFDAAMKTHINDTSPHPVYDEGPSLLLLYLNAKV